MKLLDIVAKNGATMLAMETPEASRILGLWKSGSDEPHILTRGERSHVDSHVNINGTTMIPALLALIKNDGTMRKLPKTQQNRSADLTAPAEDLVRKTIKSGRR